MDGDEARVLEVARAFQRAVAENDVDAIARHVSDDWVLVDPDGVGTKQDLVSLVASGELTHSAMGAVDGSERVRVLGELGLVTARVLNTAHLGGQVYEADEWTTDVFVRRGSGWVCVLSHVCPARSTDEG
ncbi:nuclear transport factor 2 family protein [Actinomycetospora sp. OC33-EN08]|uniref:Nuclear transport factor 2 family protein n=1 Tax=Actinomycetospora aurantiaca TaxID=3129233 RepID=A0ABU8MVX9_9PSEU